MWRTRLICTCLSHCWISTPSPVYYFHQASRLALRPTKISYLVGTGESLPTDKAWGGETQLTRFPPFWPCLQLEALPPLPCIRKPKHKNVYNFASHAVSNFNNRVALTSWTLINANFCIHEFLVSLHLQCSILSASSFWNGTQWHSLLRHYATSRKVAATIPVGVTGIFHLLKPVVDSFSNRNEYQQNFLGVKTSDA